MSEPIFTYKTLEKDSIDIYWTIAGNNPTANKPFYLEAWQKNTDIKVQADIYIRSDSLQKCIRSVASAVFMIQWHSLLEKDGTGLQGCLSTQAVNFQDTDIFIEGILPGTEIAGSIELKIILVINKEGNSLSGDVSQQIYANEKGSILFQSKQYLIVEGEQSFFPVADTDFKNAGYPAKSLYFLQRKFQSLESSFTTAYKLYFNNKHPLYHKINNFIDDNGKDFLINMIMYDVYRQLALHAIEDNNFDFEENPDYESHTVRTVYTSILKNTFPGKSLETLREMVLDNDKKNHFFCALQSDLLTYGEQ